MNLPARPMISRVVRLIHDKTSILTQPSLAQGLSVIVSSHNSRNYEGWVCARIGMYSLTLRAFSKKTGVMSFMDDMEKDGFWRMLLWSLKFRERLFHHNASLLKDSLSPMWYIPLKHKTHLLSMFLRWRRGYESLIRVIDKWNRGRPSVTRTPANDVSERVNNEILWLTTHHYRVVLRGRSVLQASSDNQRSESRCNWWLLCQL